VEVRVLSWAPSSKTPERSGVFFFLLLTAKLLADPANPLTQMLRGWLHG
jgi:hypothetical protein